jgi:transcriptional regulator with XRE-family HTH domain
MINIGSNIRKIRNLKGYSQDYLASRLDISQAAIHKIESCESNVSLQRIVTIAGILEVNVAQILDFDDTKVFISNIVHEDQASNIFTIVKESFLKERELFERIISEKDNEIAKLKAQLVKLQ